MKTHLDFKCRFLNQMIVILKSSSKVKKIIMIQITEPTEPGNHNKKKVMKSPQVDPKHTPQLLG